MFEIMNHFVLGVGLDGMLEEVKRQGSMALYIIFIIAGIFLFVKRAWGFLVTLVVGGGLLLFFVTKPEALQTIGEWIAKLINL